MKTLFVFSHLRWDFVYQRPQHVLSRLASDYAVVFFEEPVHSEGEPYLERFAPCPRVEVLRPHTPVPAHLHGFHDEQLPELRLLLADYVRDFGIDQCVAWFYTPMALPLLTELNAQTVVYDCMDELSAFSGASKQMTQREGALLKQADVVFTGGPSLYDLKRNLHSNVHCLPSAVDAGHFAPRRVLGQTPGIETSTRKTYPQLGFYGVIDERLDIGLVAALADADPQWQLVMAGPVVKIDPATLPQRPNIQWLGQQSYEKLPQLVAQWDVALLPFALNRATRFISPTKTLEYMAAERPVVSTPVKDVQRLYGDAVEIADTISQGPDAFIAACRRLLEEPLLERQQRLERMRRHVTNYSWDATTRRMKEEIERALQDAQSSQSAQDCVSIADDEVPGDGNAPSQERVRSLSSAARARGQRNLQRDEQERAVRKVHTVIIGAGAAGLAAGCELGADALLLEREAQVGGACRSIAADGFTFDVAGQGLLSDVPGFACKGAQSSARNEAQHAAERVDLYRLYDELLGANQHWRRSAAYVYHDGTYNLVFDKMRDVPQDSLPLPMAGRGARAEFGYPLRGGMQSLMDAMRARYLARGGELELNNAVVRISPQQRTLSLLDGRSLRFDNLISTMPLPLLVVACGEEAPPDVRAAAESLRQVSLRRVHLGFALHDVRAPLALRDTHWIVFPQTKSDDVSFQRIFVQGNASMHNSPAGTLGFSAEIAYGRDLHLPCSGRALIDRVVQDCVQVGLLQADAQPIVALETDMPCAYVINGEQHSARVQRVCAWLSSQGIVSAGCYGEWSGLFGVERALLAGRAAAQRVRERMQPAQIAAAPAVAAAAG